MQSEKMNLNGCIMVLRKIWHGLYYNIIVITIFFTFQSSFSFSALSNNSLDNKQLGLNNDIALGVNDYNMLKTIIWGKYAHVWSDNFAIGAWVDYGENECRIKDNDEHLLTRILAISDVVI